MSSVLYDLCDAARHLWRAPLLTLAVFAILAAGIGLNLAASNLIDSTYVPVISASVYQVAD